MTTEQNIKAILETSFTGIREDIINCALKNIMIIINNIINTLSEITPEEEKYIKIDMSTIKEAKLLLNSMYGKSAATIDSSYKMQPKKYYKLKERGFIFADTDRIYCDLTVTKRHIRAILETNFTGFRDDIIECAVENIMKIITTLTTKSCKYYNTELAYPRCYAQKCAPYTNCSGCKKYCEL